MKLLAVIFISKTGVCETAQCKVLCCKDKPGKGDVIGTITSVYPLENSGMHWLWTSRTELGTDSKSPVLQANTSKETNFCYQCFCDKCRSSGGNMTEKMQASNILFNQIDNIICYLSIIKLGLF